MLCGVELQEVTDDVSGSQLVTVSRKQEIQVVMETVTVVSSASAATQQQVDREPAAAADSSRK